MAINQEQVDHIISTASADDPEIKMQRLQEEVDLIKKSIKKLLIDIRERMNELENPFVVSNVHSGLSGERIAEPEAQKTTTEAQIATPAPTPQYPQSPLSPAPNNQVLPAPAQGMTKQLAADEMVLRSLQDTLGNMAVEEIPHEKIRLQKVHRLFDWTSKMVKKYGHDRLEIMMDSYRAMGYTSPDASDQVKEIARLMPESIGDLHEIGSDEFVTELYGLNRILDPSDASLDADMIEVLMEHRRKPGILGEKKIADEKKSAAEWADMLDRI